MRTAVNWHAHSRALHTVITESRLTAAGLMAVAVAGGALVGAFLAYVAIPGVTTCAVLFGPAVAMMLSSVRAAVRSDGVESASVVVVVTFGLLTAAPMTVSQIVPCAYRRARARARARLGAGEERDDEGDDAVAAAV